MQNWVKPLADASAKLHAATRHSEKTKTKPTRVASKLSYLGIRGCLTNVVGSPDLCQCLPGVSIGLATVGWVKLVRPKRSWPAPLEDTLNALLAEPVVNQRYPAKFAVPPAFRPDHFDSSEVVFVKNVLSVVNKAMSLQCQHNRGLTLTATRGPRKMNFSEWQPLTVQRVNQVFRRGFGALDLCPTRV